MTPPTSPGFSINTASRQELAKVLLEIVNESPSVHLTLDVSKGDDVESAIALLLSDASSEARYVFAGALGDVLQSSFEAFADRCETYNPDRMLRALDLVEIALADNIPLAKATTLGILKALAEQEFTEVTEAAARILSYLASDPAAIEILSTLYLKKIGDPTLAAYLLDARSRSNPLTAFDFLLGKIDASAFRSAAELTLAIQAAVWAMFETDGRLAKAKLEVASRDWPPTLVELVLEILGTAPLSNTFWARRSALRLAQSQELTKGIESAPTGVARRVIQRTGKDRFLKCMMGYSLGAAEHPALFESYQEPWMTRLAKEVCNILCERYPGASGINPKFERWPKHQPWRNVFDRVLLRAETEPARVDICFEMFYLDNSRNYEFTIAQFAVLKTLSVVFHEDNSAVDAHFREGGERSFPSGMSDLSVEHFLIFASKVRPRQNIYTPAFNVADELVRDLLSRQQWDGDQYRLRTNHNDLFEELRRSPNSTIVICDNVVANDLTYRGGNVGQRFINNRLKYPMDVPIGLVCDAHDPEWSNILQDAFLRIVADSAPEVKQSLRKHFSDLAAIDAYPDPRINNALSGRLIDSIHTDSPAAEKTDDRP